MVALLSCSFVSGQANDVCSGATFVAMNSQATGTLLDATDNDYTSGPCYQFSTRAGVWYTFNGTGNRVALNILEPGNVGGVVYQGSNCERLTCAAFIGMYLSNSWNSITVETLVGTTYYLLVVRDFFNGIDYNLLKSFTVTLQNLPPLGENDFCVNATPVAMESSFTGNFTLATADDDLEPYCELVAPRRPGVWYSFVGTGQRVAVRAAAANGTTNVVVKLFSGACQRSAVACGARRQIVTGGIPSTYQTVLGTTYYMLVQRAQDGNPFFDLAISSVPSTINEHDYCINAVPLAIGTSVVANATFVTSDETQVDQNCDPIYGSLYDPGLWYRVVGTGAPLTVTCNGAISIYQGSCGKSTLACVILGIRGITTFVSESGVTYYILVRRQGFMSTPVLVLSIINAAPTVLPVAPKAPVRAPTKLPIIVPPSTKAPLEPPTKAPMASPTRKPTVPPTKKPTVRPTQRPLAPPAVMAPAVPTTSGKCRLFCRVRKWIKRIFSSLYIITGIFAA
jgi:hypothetical protein